MLEKRIFSLMFILVVKTKRGRNIESKKTRLAAEVACGWARAVIEGAYQSFGQEW